MKLAATWTSGAASNTVTPVSRAPDKPRAGDCAYLPDLCAPIAVLAVVLIAELVAITLAMARQSHWISFFADLGSSSVVLQWLSLTSAAVLCGLRPRLSPLPLREGSLLAFAAVLINIFIVSEALYGVSHWIAPGAAAEGWLPADHGFFVVRNLALGGIIAGGLLRYCYVSEQWQQNVRREAEARIHALQARIRPHFLFNSMNTIASLTRSNPAAAEQAVEDLADLFRASLADAQQRITLAEELEIARVYQRMEEQRLGDRLQVNWALEALPTDAMMPGLSIQPLLENAIYHGIERLAEPGAVDIVGRRENAMLYVTVTNPTSGTGGSERPGHRMALDNIRERLVLAFGKRATLDVEEAPGQFCVTLAFPYETRAA